nr:hypothetical protein CJLB15_00052 [Campylobacter phage CJLB-15]
MNWENNLFVKRLLSDVEKEIYNVTEDADPWVELTKKKLRKDNK